MADEGIHDFDFCHGQWSVHHRRLKERLAGSTDWDEFGGHSQCRPTLGGAGNVEDNLILLPEGSYRAVAIRSFDANSKLWSIWWLDGRNPHVLEVPVVGSFRDGVGEFLADDALNGIPIRVRFQWIAGAQPVWKQAFSSDGGQSWEENWIMQFTPAAGAAQ